MRIPLSWLREYVDWPDTVEELADLLSLSGTEIEGIDWVGAPRAAANLALVRIGRVITRDKHPNADKLSLCRVDIGGGEERQIVCGADNFAAGDVVAVALVGATLENGLKLKKANLRGVASDGMMLSEQELGFETASPGIVVLPAGWPVGAPLADHLPIAEAVLAAEITPNRPDCLSIYGIAREVAAVAGLPLRPAPFGAPPTAGKPSSADIAVEVDDADLCSRYGAQVTRGVTVAASPPWLKARLTHAGMRPINNVVDVTNYVMLAIGQPLHAFDLHKIEGGKLIVRRAKPGEPITTLDEVERKLTGEMLVIADVAKPLVIAGVFGSVDAEVDDQTTDLVLEAANFNAPNIMRTSEQTMVRSEASSRFEKGLDAEGVVAGLAMASRLFAELCGGTVAPGVVDVRVAAGGPKPLRYRPAKCDGLLGLAIAPREQATILRRLDCVVEEVGDEYSVTPPSFRIDLAREVDLIEEVGRVHGYGEVPETLPLRRAAVGVLTAAQVLRRRLREALTACGLDEIVTYSFTSRESLAALDISEGDVRRSPVVLANPMSAEQAVMRTTLLPGLLGTLRDNLAKQNYPLCLFEEARVYLATADKLPREIDTLGIALCGPLHADNWHAVGRPSDFFTLKGIVTRALAAVGAPAATWRPCVEPFLHPGKSADVLIGERRLGYCGQLRPDIAARCGVEEGDVYVAELSLAELVRHAFRPHPFEDLVTYPAAGQDIAVVVGRDVPAADVLTTARKAGGKLLHDVAIFDVYEGEQVPADKRSLALRLTMRSPERTLSDKDITAVRERVLAALARDFAATLR
jgi:phenylalanyl-tRNA synthetase beta chain